MAEGQQKSIVLHDGVCSGANCVDLSVCSVSSGVHVCVDCLVGFFPVFNLTINACECVSACVGVQTFAHVWAIPTS